MPAGRPRRDDVLSEASRPLISVQTVTKVSRTEGNGVGVQIEVIAGVDHDRPGGRRFGALVHALLAAVDLNATSEAIRTAAATHGRLVGATEREMNAAIISVVAALKHPVMVSASAQAGNGRLHVKHPYCSGARMAPSSRELLISRFARKHRSLTVGPW